MEWSVISIVGALLASGLVGRRFACEILAEEPNLPSWLETVAPVKGRWLALLLAGPSLLVAMLMTFIGTLFPFGFISYVIDALWGVNGTLGVTALIGGCLIFRGLKKAEPKTEQHPSRGSR
jgi:hypothetical protein